MRTGTGRAAAEVMSALPPIASSLLALAIALPLARAGGALAARAGQPPVLGELVAGLAVAAMALFGIPLSIFGDSAPGLQVFAEIGAAVLLFEAGLESEPAELARVGAASLLVACAGVIAPTLLGYWAAHLLLPGAGWLTCLFIGATLSATSVGITVRVLRDLGRSTTREARIIVGAAVADDVLGLLLLSALVAIARAQDAGAQVSASDTLLLLGKAMVFLGGTIALAPPLLRRALRGGEASLPLGLAVCFFLSWAADRIGLAPVVGAFVAGVVLSGSRPKAVAATEAHGVRLHPGVRALGACLVPIFFFVMGLRVDLAAALQGQAPRLALALVAVALVGKIVSGLAVPGRGVDRLAVGVGMIPRGEVGLIFAGIGQQLSVHGQPLVGSGVMSALVLVMLATTCVTPPALRWVFARGSVPRLPDASVTILREPAADAAEL